MVISIAGNQGGFLGALEQPENEGHSQEMGRGSLPEGQPLLVPLRKTVPFELTLIYEETGKKEIRGRESRVHCKPLPFMPQMDPLNNHSLDLWLPPRAKC